MMTLEHAILRFNTWLGAPTVVSALISIYVFALAPAGERMHTPGCVSYTVGDGIFLAVQIISLSSGFLFGLCALLYSYFKGVSLDDKETQNWLLKIAFIAAIIIVCVEVVFALFALLLTDCSESSYTVDYGNNENVEYTAYAVIIMNFAFALCTHGYDFIEVLYERKPTRTLLIRTGLPHLLDVLTELVAVVLLFILIKSDEEQDLLERELLLHIEDPESCGYKLSNRVTRIFNNTHSERICIATIVFIAIPLAIHMLEMVIHVLGKNVQKYTNTMDVYNKSTIGYMACRIRIGFLCISKWLFAWLFGAIIMQMADPTCVGFAFSSIYIAAVSFFIVNIMTNVFLFIQSVYGTSIFSINFSA